jgi:hypothetical protein
MAHTVHWYAGASWGPNFSTVAPHYAVWNWHKFLVTLYDREIGFDA